MFTHVLPEAFERFLACAMWATRHCSTWNFDVFVPKRTLLHMAMNQAAEHVMAHPAYAGLITFDDDCLPPIDAVPRLLAHGQDIVSGLGYMRAFPYTPTLGKFHREGPLLTPTTSGYEYSGFYWLDRLPDPPGLVEVDFSGVPITWISRRVFCATEPPWFQNRDLGGGTCTHDIYFCQLAKAAGFRIYVDTTLDVGHLIANPIVNGETRKQVLAMTEEQT